MLSDTTIKRLSALGEISKQGKRANGLFRLMENPFLWEQAYANIYSNKGAMTKGVDKTTMDGFSHERAVKIIKLLKEDHYPFKPSRRVYIPKANGKMRPLGIPTADDKLVQEVTRNILEQIYEPVFKDSSHGFRPRKSCHTALRCIQRSWTGIKWVIDMDIQGFFDNIDHEIMIRLLEKRIDDKRFIGLIKAMMKAGYVDDWKYHCTYSGTPQGGIISPILANIYLHELDEFMENMIVNFNEGKSRQRNSEYRHYEHKISNLRKEFDEIRGEGNEDRLKEIRDEIRNYDRIRKKLPAFNGHDQNFKRLTYCRYADDFVIGVIASKEDSINIMDKVRHFIHMELKLTVAEDKSGIRHAKDTTRFLGYNISMFNGERIVKTTRCNRHITVRSISEKIDLSIPQEKLAKFCQSKGYGNYDLFSMFHRPKLLNLSDAEIITIYNAEFRGLVNYYILATSARKTLGKLQGIWIGSLFKTLAQKHQCSVSSMARKIRISAGEYGLTERYKGKTRTIRIFRMKDIEKEPKRYLKVDECPDTSRYRAVYSELARRMRAQKCEYCGQSEILFEVHHVGQLKNIQNGTEKWQQLMNKMRRKTLVLCKECHQLLHDGELSECRYSMYK